MHFSSGSDTRGRGQESIMVCHGGHKLSIRAYHMETILAEAANLTSTDLMSHVVQSIEHIKQENIAGMKRDYILRPSEYIP